MGVRSTKMCQDRHGCQEGQEVSRKTQVSGEIRVSGGPGGVNIDPCVRREWASGGSRCVKRDPCVVRDMGVRRKLCVKRGTGVRRDKGFRKG